MRGSDLLRFGASCGVLMLAVGPALAAEPPGITSGANVDFSKTPNSAIPPAAITDASGNLAIGGRMTANTFYGDGSHLTGVGVATSNALFAPIASKLGGL